MDKLSQFIYKHFKVIWLIGSVALLAFTLEANWSYSLKYSQRVIQKTAQQLSNNMDGLIEDLFQEVYTLPLYGKEFKDCKLDIYPELQHITVNNPKISGLIITNASHKFVCSNLPENNIFLTNATRARTITGPLKVALFDQPIYVIKQKMGNYYISIVVVSSLLESALHTTDNITNSIALFNKFKKQNILHIEHTDNNKGWIFSSNLEQNSPLTTTQLFSMAKLQSIDGISVVAFENHNTAMYNLWSSQIIVSIGFIIVSTLLYLLLRNLYTKRYSLSGLLKMAVKNNEFYPVYQPVFDKLTGKYTGAEILLRWQDNQQEIIMPDFFIEEAENTGLIIPITLKIIDIAFRECRPLLQANPGFHLAFNLTASHFTDDHFFITLDKLCKTYNISPKQLILEITERDLLDQHNAIYKAKMEQLIQEGYSLALDDYGTGHASISYLQNFPFNYLKIDQLFVKAIGTKAVTESLIDVIIQMAKRLNLIIIAEGVETAEQVDYLVKNGVQYLQGWYFSRAISYTDLMALLSETHHDN